MKKSHHPPSRALSQDELEKRRKQAVKYFNNESITLLEIAKKFGVTKQAVFLWKKKWGEEGTKGLNRGVYGRISKMTKEQETKIKRDILKGAKFCGYDTDFWTLKRITDYVKKITKIKYSDRSIWHTMERFGFSCQVPERRATERNEKAIKTWVEITWPAIKKGA